MPSLDNLLKMGSEAAMMFGADNRKDIYQGIDRLNSTVVNSATADILANSDLDFDNPASFAPVISKLNQLSPGLGNEMGKTLYSISDERMKAAAEAAKNAAMGRSYLSKSKNFDAQAALNQAKTNTQTLGTEYVTQAVNRGEGTNLQGARVLFGDGDVPLSQQQQYDIVTKQAAEKKTAAIEAAKIKAAEKKTGRTPKFRGPSTKDSKPIMTTGISFFRSKYPDANFTDAEGNMPDWAAVIILDAYQRGESIARERNIPARTMQDIFALGFQDMEGNISEMTAPDNQGTVLTLSRDITNMPAQVKGTPPQQPPIKNQQPDSSNYHSVFNQPPVDKVVAETAQWVKENPNVTKQQIVLQMMNQYKALGLSKEETKARINAFFNQGQQ